MAEQPRLDRPLRMLITISGIRHYSISELADHFGISERTVHRYLATIRDAGFVVERHHSLYHIPRIQEPFKDIGELLHFSSEEAYILSQAIHSIDDTNVLKSNLIKKLYSLYDFKRVAETIVKPDNSRIVHQLIEAIGDKKQVLLRSYRSAHGAIIRDRKVEPFAFTTNYISLWAYEPESGECKIFKTTRIGKVEILSQDHQHEDQHRTLPMDVFRISSELQLPIKLRMTLRAYNLLVEEYPLAQQYTTQADNNVYMFEADVCSYEGVGRFVLGLLEEIPAIEPPEFRNYLKERIGLMNLP